MVLQNDLNSGLMWCGLSGKKLGTLPQSEYMDLSLNLITTVPGLQVIISQIKSQVNLLIIW